jgi:hypothetical protein
MAAKKNDQDQTTPTAPVVELEEEQPSEQPQTAPSVITITAEELRRLLNPKADVPAGDGRKLDETVPGGKYKVGGQWVNAEGKRLDDQSED